MRISTSVRSLGTLVLAAAFALVNLPAAQAQTDQSPYPQWGQVLDANALVSAITSQAGKSLIDPNKPQQPAQGMLQTKPDNSTTKNPEAFGPARGGDRNWYGVQIWFGKPNSVKPDGQKCSSFDTVLARDLVDVKLGSDGCTVESGRLVDPFGDAHTAFQLENVVVVNVVSPEYAFARGGHALSADRRLAFTNDPLNLVAVPKGLADRMKASLFSTPVEDEFYSPANPNINWLPSQGSGARQVWAARYATVTMKYGLTLEADSATKFSDLMKGWNGSVDTSAAGAAKLASTRFVEMIPGVALPTASASPTPSTGQTSSPATSSPGTAAPTQEQNGTDMPWLPILLGMAVAAVAAIGFFTYRSRDKRGGSRAG